MSKLFEKFEIEEVELEKGSIENQKSKRSMIKNFLIFIIFSFCLFVINDLITFYLFKPGKNNF